MDIIEYDDSARFLERAAPVLGRNEAFTGLIYGVADRVGVTLSTFHAVELITPAAQSFLDSKWNITMTFKGEGINPFTIPSIYLFPTKEGFFDGVCENPRKNTSQQ